MKDFDQKWFDYISSEVERAYQDAGMHSQVRRKWSARGTAVSDSGVEDYEWKLIPTSGHAGHRGEPDGFFGVYYLLAFEQRSSGFIWRRPGEPGSFLLEPRDQSPETGWVPVLVFYHDQESMDLLGPECERVTRTEIVPRVRDGHIPKSGWLTMHLRNLVRRFKPNQFTWS